MDSKIQLQADHQEIMQCQMTSQDSCLTHDQRRSANYKPNIWKQDFIESLNNKYDGDKYVRQSETLMEDVKNRLFVGTEDLMEKLELIDNITKLGLTNLFENEIKEVLDTIASIDMPCSTKTLYVTALHFKILRQNGYKVSQDVFGDFMEENVTLKKSAMADVKGVLEIYEASNLAFEGEEILDRVRASTKLALREANRIDHNLDSNLARNVEHGLKLSSRRRLPWFDVKWNINSYENDSTTHKNTSLLQLAKLNFNMVQSLLQKDLKEASMWWNHLGITEKLNFARDRLVECFTCATGLAFQPEYRSFRIWLTKVINLILIIDDVFDIYGSLEELRHFTKAVDRWDVRETEQLPECMKICFQVLYNTTCETACEIEERNGGNLVLPHLSKVWADFCKALLVEAEWYSKGYTPSLEEYLSNGCISSSVSVILVHAFFATTYSNASTQEADFLHQNEDLVHNVSLIVRLTNDLATSEAERERGDVASSIICYMREVKSSEESARKNLKGMIDNAWKKINAKCLIDDPKPVPFLSSFIGISTNMARVGHFLYEDGDGFGDQERGTRTQIQSLLVEPYVMQGF